MNETYPELYHYTREPAVKEIVGKQCLLAGHHLNHPNEIEHFRPPLLTGLLYHPLGHPIVTRRTLSPEAAEANSKNFHSLQNYLPHQEIIFGEKLDDPRSFMEPYITSFIGHNQNKASAEMDISAHGHAYHWIKYGGGSGNGYALVFDTQGLMDKLAEAEGTQPSHQFTTYLTKVEYPFYGPPHLENWEPNVRVAFEKLTELMLLEFRRYLRPGDPGFADFLQYYIRVAPAIKNPKFSDDNETRLVYMRRPERMLADCERFHQKKFALKQPQSIIGDDGKQRWYISLFDGVDLPIKRIIIGPGGNQEERAQMVKKLLPSKVEILLSQCAI